MINDLAKKYEAGGDPAAISSGNGDLGGASYGIYQFASNTGAVESFLIFASKYENEALANYGNVLSEFKVNSQEFKELWKKIGTIDPEGFSELQTAYAYEIYYQTAAQCLREQGYEIENKSNAMKAVVFSRAVQYGSGNIVELYQKATSRMGYPNLSYVDNSCFDTNMIIEIYNFLIEECDNATVSESGSFHSPNDWVNGSLDIVDGLKNRFENEKEDALKML